MEVIKQITNAVGNVIGSFFHSDLDVMSTEARKILSNPEDKEKYIQAIKTLQTEKEATITLSNKETITLVS